MSTLCTLRMWPSRWLAFASPQATGVALGVLAAVIWGSYFALARAGVSVGLYATDIAAIRYGVAGLIMLPWLLRSGAMGMAGIGLMRACALALLVGPLFIIIGVSGYNFAPLAHGAVVQPAALTLGSIGLASLVLRDRPTVARIIGVTIMLAGLAIIAGPGLLKSGAVTPIGDAMFAGAGLMWALFTILLRRWGISPIAGTAVVSVLSAAVYLPIYVAGVGFDRIIVLPMPMLIAQVLVQGVLSGVVAVIAYSKAVEVLGAGKAAVFPALIPAVAIVLGVPLTGEVPTTLQLCGLGFVSLGLLFSVGVLRIPSLRVRSVAVPAFCDNCV